MTSEPPSQILAASGDALAIPTQLESRDRAHALFGQVMGLVALTTGCAALGAYLGRNPLRRCRDRIVRACFRLHFRTELCDRRRA